MCRVLVRLPGFAYHPGGPHRHYLYLQLIADDLILLIASSSSSFFDDAMVSL